MKGKIFNAQEVQAIISRNKKMFREVIKNANYDSPVHSYKDWENNGLYYPVVTLVDENGTQFTETQYSFDGIRCPYQVGQKIFCKEAWGRKATGSGIAYKTDNPNQLIYQHLPVKWRLPQHMKQEHSRLTLEITNIKVERLAKISEGDAIKEGLDLDSEHSRLCLNIQDQPYSNDLIDGSAFKTIFAKNWNATHKKPEEKFEANPFVWVVDFKINK